MKPLRLLDANACSFWHEARGEPEMTRPASWKHRKFRETMQEENRRWQVANPNRARSKKVRFGPECW